MRGSEIINLQNSHGFSRSVVTSLPSHAGHLDRLRIRCFCLLLKRVDVQHTLNTIAKKFMRRGGCSGVSTQEQHQPDMIDIKKGDISEDTRYWSYFESLGFLHHLLKKRMRSLSCQKKNLSLRNLTQMRRWASHGWQHCHLRVTTKGLQCHDACSHPAVVGENFLVKKTNKNHWHFCFSIRNVEL